MVVLINLPPPEEGIHYSECSTKAYYQDRNLGIGTLYIAESIVCWINSEGQGFSLTYPAINLHAVSKDISSFPEECLFLLISDNLDETAANQNEDEEDDEYDDDPSYEIRFVPDNKDSLDIMFKAMSDCQALNPDEAASSDPEGDFFEIGDNHAEENDEENYEDAEGEEAIYYTEGNSVHIVHAGEGDTGAINEADTEFLNGQVEAMEIGQFEDADQSNQ